MDISAETSPGCLAWDDPYLISCLTLPLALIFSLFIFFLTGLNKGIEDVASVGELQAYETAK